MSRKLLVLAICSIIVITLGAIGWDWLNKPRVSFVYWSFIPLDDNRAQFVCLHAFSSYLETYADVIPDDYCSGEMDANFHYPDCTIDGKVWTCKEPWFRNNEKISPEEIKIGLRIPL